MHLHKILYICLPRSIYIHTLAYTHNKTYTVSKIYINQSQFEYLIKIKNKKLYINVNRFRSQSNELTQKIQ